jgi:hypothetical protein
MRLLLIQNFVESTIIVDSPQLDFKDAEYLGPGQGTTFSVNSRILAIINV